MFEKLKDFGPECERKRYYKDCVPENTANIRNFSFILILSFTVYLLMALFVLKERHLEELKKAYIILYIFLIGVPGIFTVISFFPISKILFRIINFTAILLYGFFMVILSTLDYINSQDISAFIILILVYAIIFHERKILKISGLIFFLLFMSFNLFFFHSDAYSTGILFDIYVYTAVALILSVIMERSHFRLYCTSQKLEEKSKQLEELSFKDSLTGLFNRRYLFSMLKKEIIRFNRRKIPFSIILFDIDHFKKVNDIYGHILGDRVLSVMGELTKEEFRGEDIASRYGGEEFLIVLIGTSLESAYMAAERLRIKIENTQFPDIPEKITASFGVAEYISDKDIELFIARADKNLYKAKRGGRNRVVK